MFLMCTAQDLECTVNGPTPDDAVMAQVMPQEAGAPGAFLPAGFSL